MINPKWDLKMMVEVAKMYHKDNMTQERISKELGISRSTISLILSEAKEYGIIEINIKDPFTNKLHLAEQLKMEFDLEDCIVIPTSISSIPLLTRIVASQAVLAAEQYLKSHTSIGIAWGLTCYEFMRSMRNEKNIKDVEVVPLIGGSSNVSSEYQLNEIVRIFAEKMQGTPSFIYAPATVQTTADKELYMQSLYMRSIVEKWKNLDIAIVSAGAPPEYYSTQQIILPDEALHLYTNDQGRPVGDICARQFNIQGEFLQNEHNEKVMGINEKSLRNAGKVMCIAAGAHKVMSILGVLRTGIIHYFVTDENTANEVLHLL